MFSYMASKEEEVKYAKIRIGFYNKRKRLFLLLSVLFLILSLVFLTLAILLAVYTKHNPRPLVYIAGLFLTASIILFVLKLFLYKNRLLDCRYIIERYEEGK